MIFKIIRGSSVGTTDSGEVKWDDGPLGEPIQQRYYKQNYREKKFPVVSDSAFSYFYII